MSSAQENRKKQSSTAMQQNALPPDIHSGVVSPAQTKLSSKAQSIGLASAKYSNSQASHGRKIQTVARDANAKLRTQRSTSRGADVRDFRGIRTDRRGTDDHYGRPESRGAEDSQDREGEESKERTLTASSHHNNSKFEGTMKFNSQQLGSIGNTNRSTQNTLRDSHDSMRSIQKQRIQRSLQKSQEGRKKLEEKLEAISTRDRQFYAQNANVMASMNSSAVSGNNQDAVNVERGDDRHQGRYEERNNQTGSLLATKGGFQNLRNKDQIRDQMLASISKIKSYRETGEFDMSGISAIQSVSGASIANASERITGLSDVNIEAPQEFQTNTLTAPRERCSDQVLMAEPTIDHATSVRQPQNMEHEAFQENSGNRGTYQTASFHNQSQHSQDNLSSLSSIHHFQSTKSTTNMNSKSNMGSQLHIINAQLKNKICSTIEEAQPFLKMCLVGGNGANFTSTQGVSTSTIGSITGANESGQFSSILSNNADSMELDKNLICPKCNYIVVGPVECQSCQYIICFKCAQAIGMTCDDEACGEKFTSSPGKIHKLYREMLYQLEFRCPNQGQGCSKILKYDQLDLHLQKSCEARLQLCPNRCSKTQKFSVQVLQKHLDEDCPKECLPCPQCKQIKFRMEIEEHLANSCDKVLVKCQDCNQTDLRLAFKNGKHECVALRNEEHQYSISLRRSQEKQRDREQRPRDYDDFAHTGSMNTRQDEEEGMFDASGSRGNETLLTGPVTQAQMKVTKDEIQNIQNLITVDIFQMIDTFGKALTAKEKEVDDLKKKVHINQQYTVVNEEEMQLLRSQNAKLEKQGNQASQQYAQIQAQYVQQADRYEELITNLTVKQTQHAKKIDELQMALLQRIQLQDKKLESYEEMIKESNKKFAQQANKHAEIIAKMSIKQEQSQNMLKAQEELIQKLKQQVQSQMDQRANEDQIKNRKIEEMAGLVETMRRDQTQRDENYDELIASLIKKFDSKISHVLDVQLRQQEENDQFQKFVIDQVRKSREQQESQDQRRYMRQGDENDENLNSLSIRAPESQNLLSEEQSRLEQKLHESTVSESLDEEILAQHYAKQQYQTEQLPFQRNLKVPPINLGTSLARKHMKRRSPKHQKHYSEDIRTVQSFQNKNDQLQKEEVAQQIRNQLYPAVSDQQQDDAESPEVEIAKDGRITQKEKMKQLKRADDPDHNLPVKQDAKEANIMTQKIEEIVEDIDESQFIPAYLSACENDRDVTDLNRTELNTEYNTARPVLGAGGGQTERVSSKGSQQYKDRSARNPARKNQVGRNKKEGGGLTDRERGTMPLTSEVQSSLQSTYRISQSTQRQPDNKDSKDSNSDDIMRTSPQQILIEDHPEAQNKAAWPDEKPRLQQKPKNWSANSEDQSFVNESEATHTELQRQEREAQLNLNQESAAVESREQADHHQAPEVGPALEQQPPRRPLESQEIEEMAQRRSVPNSQAQPYNDNMAKTYESSEFEQQSPEGLPGDIFGAGISTKFHDEVNGSSAAPSRELLASKTSQLSKASKVPSKIQSTDRSGLHMTSPMASDQSLGNLQVNLDQNLSQFYALAQNHPLKMEKESSSQGLHNTTTEQTQLQSKVEDRIKQAQDDFNPYTALEGNQIMSHTLRVEKMKQENFIEQVGRRPEDQEEYRKIEHDIQNLRQKYQNETSQPPIESCVEEFGKSINTDDQLQQALRELEKSHDDEMMPHSTLRRKDIAKLQPPMGKNSQEQSDNSEFEREEGSNGENIDNIIHQILEGDDLFKRKKKQPNNRRSEPEGIKQDNPMRTSNMPFELGRQSSRDTSNTQHEIDQILYKAQEKSDNSVRRQNENSQNRGRNSSKTSDDERESGENGLNSNSKDSKDIDQDLIQDDAQMPNEQPFPTGLESDLETILETDQESNYMTTARTNQQKSIIERSMISNQVASTKQQPSASGQNHQPRSLLEGNQLEKQPSQSNQERRESLNQSQLQLNQSLNSLNNSSFVVQDGMNALPQNIYQADKPEQAHDPAEALDDDSQLFKTQKKSLSNMHDDIVEKNLNSLLNDISPIAHAIEASSYQNTRYTNILDSARTANANSDAADGMSAQKGNENPDRLGHGNGAGEVEAELPRQLFIGNQSNMRDLVSPSQENMVTDRSINASSIHIHFPDDVETSSDAKGLGGPPAQQHLVLQNRQHQPTESGHQNWPISAATASDEVDNEEEKLSESRITSQKTYYDKVLSAISDSAKKKQKEQKDILRQIEMEMELKRQNAKASRHSDADEQTKQEDFSPTAATRAETKKLLTQGETLDRADIDRELQMILRKNRSAYAQKAAEEATEESKKI